MKKIFLCTVLGLMGIMGTLSIGVVDATATVVHYTGSNIEYRLNDNTEHFTGVGTITIQEGDKVITILDRNLGATEAGTGCDSGFTQCKNGDPTYGYHFQWGNNYGFTVVGTLPQLSKSQVNSGEVGANYSTGVFHYGYNNWIDGNKVDMWGGKEESNYFIPLQENDAKSRRGPCPYDFHVPSSSELRTIREMMENIPNMHSQLLIPFAGKRDYTSRNGNVVVGEIGLGAYLWGSSIKGEEQSSILYLNVNGGMGSTSNFRSSGRTIRCFYNYYKPYPIQVKLTFDIQANGGIYATTGSKVVESGTIIDLSQFTGYKAGWDFVGWNTNSRAHDAMSSLTVTEPITLYAIFSKTLTGTYTATNATIAGDLTSDTCKMYNNDTSCSITLPSITCNAGYHTPVWTPANLNNITSNTGATASCTACGDGTYTVDGNTATSCTACEAGYYCPSGIKTQCPAGYTSNTGSSAENECYEILTATFNTNGATSVSSGSITCKKYYGSGNCSITTPTINPADGFEALGFNTLATDTGSTILQNTSLNIAGEEEYYAITKSSSPIKITFDINGNGGTTYTGECYRYNGSGSCSVTSPDITPAPGFTAIGWSTNIGNHTNEWTGGIVKTVTADATYYAQSEKAGYTVTASYVVGTGVSAIGATSGKCNVDTIYNGSGYLPCNITLTTIDLKPGYNTGVWSTGNNVLNPGSGISLLSDDTYTASSTPNTYSVKFEAGEGTGTMDNQNFTYDVAQNLTDNAFTRTGYTFSGWATTANGAKVYDDKASVSNLTGTNGATVTLYAQWIAETYTVTFDVNGGNALTPNTGAITYDAVYGTLPTLTRDGYSFNGWFTAATSGTKITSSTIVSSTGDHTLYAHWTQNPASGGSSSGGGGGGGGGSTKTTTKTTTGTVTTGSVATGAVITGTVITGTNETNVKTDNQTNLEGKNNQNNGDKGENQKYSDEFQQAYEFAYKHGITTMPTIEQANMEGPLTRIAMAKMLSYYAINVLGQKPDTSRKINFKDVSAALDKKYDNGVTLAYQLGIMGINMKNNKFRPNDLVTRAEFGTALSRMLYGIADGKDKYYSTHLAKLMEEKIITNDDPKMKELRGYVMIMLMRSAENKNTEN